MERSNQVDGLNQIAKIIFSLILISINHSVLSIEISKLPTPNWVKEKPLPTDYEIPKEQLRNGVYYLLVDTQTHVPKKQDKTTYHRYIKHITNPAGIESSSQLNFEYDPIYEEINIHAITIWRDGVAIDKIKTATINKLQQESEAENLIYNGSETINFILDDIREGDILDYSYSITGSNPVFNGIFSQANSVQWRVPVLQRSIRILWLKNNELFIKQHETNLPIKTTPIPNGVEYTLNETQIPLIKADDDIPSWFNKYGFIEFSETKNWRQVIEWSLPLFNNAVSADITIKEVADKIKSSSDSKKEKLLKALHFVQQEVRYLGIEMGVNSHQPTPAHETLQRRYGDCKDKTVLLISILKQLGIEAFPALVNTDLAHILETRLPRASLFDHVIVKVTLNNTDYWLDPTRQYQNSKLDKVFQPDYTMALVISEKNQDIEKTIVQQESTQRTILEEFDIPVDVTDDVTFTVKTYLSGLNAESNRSSIASRGSTELSENYLKYYSDYYNDINIAQETAFEEQDNGDRVSNEYYQIGQFWEKNDNDKRYYATFYNNTISSYLTQKKLSDRKDPLLISHPVHIKHIIKVKFNDGNWSFPTEKVEESNEIFDYSSEIHFDDKNNLLTFNYQYKSKTDHVPPELLAVYDSALKKLENEYSYGIYRKFPCSGESEQQTTPENDSSDEEYNWVIIALITYFVLLLLSVLLWRINLKRNPFQGEMLFFPVSKLKLITMVIFTFGIYGSYWVYKNFKYIKQQTNQSMMPLARGIFDQFWYYSLYSQLAEHSQHHFNENRLIKPVIAGLFAIIYFIISVSQTVVDSVLLLIVISALLLLPLLSYVNQLNSPNEQAIRYNSRWSIHHVLVFLLSFPLLLLTLGSSVGLLPSDSVITGNKLLSHDIQFLQRKKIIELDEKIDYFYSDAFLFIRKDGNGLTSKQVFSYWVNEDDQFEVERAKYEEIKNIEVTWSKSSTENTVIKIIRHDDSSFLLFVSRDDKKDKVFVAQLKKHWNSIRNTVNTTNQASNG